MIAAATLAHQSGKMQAGELERLESICELWGMPARIDASMESQSIIDAIQTDKKRIGGKLHFIMPVRVGKVIEATDIDQSDLNRALKSIGAG